MILQANDNSLENILKRIIPTKTRMTDGTARNVVAKKSRQSSANSQEQNFRKYLKYVDPMLQYSDESSDASKLSQDLQRILDAFAPRPVFQDPTDGLINRNNDENDRNGAAQAAQAARASNAVAKISKAWSDKKLRKKAQDDATKLAFERELENQTNAVIRLQSAARTKLARNMLAKTDTPDTRPGERFSKPKMYSGFPSRGLDANEVMAEKLRIAATPKKKKSTKKSTKTLE
jgi:hypothetical protein